MIYFEYSHANASTMWILGPLNQGNIFNSNVMGQKNLLQNISFFVILLLEPNSNQCEQDSVFKMIFKFKFNY